MNDQKKRMLDDISQKNPLSGTYRGINWKMTRPFNTYLCGYINVKEKIIKNIGDIEDVTHGGITGGEKNWVGFDCAHAGDYAPLIIRDKYIQFVEGIYRDYNYVLAVIKKMIDVYLAS